MAAAAAAGVERLITVGCDVAAVAPRTSTLARRHPGVVWATAGVHPHDASDGHRRPRGAPRRSPRSWPWGSAASTSTTTTRRATCSATCSPRRSRWPTRHDLALVIHTREAWAETFDVLAAEGVPERTVFHCFTGGPDEARRCLDLGAVPVVQRHRHVPVGRPTCRPPRGCARSTGCSSRPTAPTSRRCPTGASATSPAWVPVVGDADRRTCRALPPTRWPPQPGRRPRTPTACGNHEFHA